MIIHIHKHENPYVILDKTFLSDDRLSWRAKGLLAYLLSKPADWQVRVSDLVKKSSDGETAVRNTLKELEETGYLIKERKHDEKGQFSGIEYVVFENPQGSDSETIFEKTICGETKCGESSTTKERDLLKNDLIAESASQEIEPQNPPTLTTETLVKQWMKIHPAEKGNHTRNAAFAYKTFAAAIQEGISPEQIATAIEEYADEIKFPVHLIEQIRRDIEQEEKELQELRRNVAAQLEEMKRYERRFDGHSNGTESSGDSCEVPRSP